MARGARAPGEEHWNQKSFILEQNWNPSAFIYFKSWQTSGISKRNLAAFEWISHSSTCFQISKITFKKNDAQIGLPPPSQSPKMLLQQSLPVGNAWWWPCWDQVPKTFSEDFSGWWLVSFSLVNMDYIGIQYTYVYLIYIYIYTVYIYIYW